MDQQTALKLIGDTFDKDLPPLVMTLEEGIQEPRYWLTKYGRSRFWAVYDGGDLVAVTVYKKGATELLKRLAA